MVERPHARVGGRGYSITGHHEIMIPLLAAALVEAGRMNPAEAKVRALLVATVTYLLFRRDRVSQPAAIRDAGRGWLVRDCMSRKVSQELLAQSVWYVLVFGFLFALFRLAYRSAILALARFATAVLLTPDCALRLGPVLALSHGSSRAYAAHDARNPIAV